MIRVNQNQPQSLAPFKHKLLLCLALALSLCPLSVSATSPQAKFDAAFDEVLRRYDLPGLAVAVVEKDQLVYQRTAGELIVKTGQKINADSLFKIASNSKAMTAAVLARLVDQKKLSWDDPVIKYLPQFRLYDPWVTQNMQVRDLLIHNSGLGLGAGDLMLWPEPNRFSRSDIIAGLAHLKPTHSFRSHYSYDNLLYVVAGEVAASAAGQPYETLVQQEIFTPLGMLRCQVGAWNRDTVGNVAQPHMHGKHGNQLIRADAVQIPNVSSMAAGGIRCSLNDMTTWLQVWLSPQRRAAWLSDEQARLLWLAHMPMPVTARMHEWDNSHVSAYGFGWRLSDVDGVWKVAHTGTLAGMYSSVILLPDKRVGIVILINGDGEAARTVLGQVLTKHFTAPNKALNAADYADKLASAPSTTIVRSALLANTRKPASLQHLATHLGRYRDAWFGEVSLCMVDQQVKFISQKSSLMRAKVMHVDGRYLLDWDADSVDAEAWLDFDSINGHMRLSHVDPNADFSYDFADLDFERIGECF